MILSFKPYVFAPLIVLCKGIEVLEKITKYFPAKGRMPKIHSLRDDTKKRWKEGMSIQFWEGSPRNSHNSHTLHFANGICTAIQEVEICWMSRKGEAPRQAEELEKYMVRVINHEKSICIQVDGKYLTTYDAMQFIFNDGFQTVEDFAKWFEPPKGECVVKKRLIHWTDKRY